MQRWTTRPLGALSLVVGLAACSASEDPSKGLVPSPWPGFTRIEGLGDRCTASAAAVPEEEYKPLQFIPCASGMAGCEELKFSAGVGRPGLSTFDYSVAFDPSGVASRLLVVHRGWLEDPRDQLPAEAVVFEIASGRPSLAVRNSGNAPEEGVFHSNPLHCLITPAISHEQVSVLAVVSGNDPLSVGRTSHSAPMGPLVLRETVADLTALTHPIATDQIMATIQSDGLIHRFAFDGSPDVSTYGPAVKLRLTRAVGGDVYASDNPGQTYQLASSGEFLPAPAPMVQFNAAGGWAAWLERAATGSASSHELFIAKYSSDLSQLEGSKQLLAPVNDPGGLAFGDGWVAVIERKAGCSASVFELATGAKRTAKLDPGGPFCGPWPLAVVGGHIWVIQRSVAGESVLQRYGLAPG